MTNRRGVDPLVRNRAIIHPDGTPTVPFMRQFDQLRQRSGWTVAGRWSFAIDGNTASPLDFVDLGFPVSEILIIANNLTKSVSGILQMRVSDDGGATFLSTNGNYETIDVNGVATQDTELDLHATAATAARHATAHIRNAQVGSVKAVTRLDGDFAVINTVNSINAVRLILSAGGDFTGGSLEVLVR